VEAPWVADSSEEEDDWEAHVLEHGVITQEAPGLGVAHAGTSPATPVRDVLRRRLLLLLLPLLLVLPLLLLLLL
jgi:hypothetical protein